MVSGPLTFKSKNTSPFLVTLFGSQPTYTSLQPITHPLPACMQGQQVDFSLTGRSYAPVGFVNPGLGQSSICCRFQTIFKIYINVKIPFQMMECLLYAVVLVITATSTVKSSMLQKICGRVSTQICDTLGN